MSALEGLAVALIALALAFPAGVAFGIRIGQMRERDNRRRRQGAFYMLPHQTRHLLDWSNGKGSQEDL